MGDDRPRGRTLFTSAAARESRAQRYPQESLAYLASPYTKYPHGLERAFTDAAKIAADLLAAGVAVYSPIVHCHPLAMYGNLDPLDHKIWLPFNQTMLGLAQVLIVAHMEGWQDSFGVTHEIATFEKNGKRIFDLDPQTFVMVQRRLSGDR